MKRLMIIVIVIVTVTMTMETRCVIGCVSDEMMSFIEGGLFEMGNSPNSKIKTYIADGESPVRHVFLSPYRIDKTEVAVKSFAEFVLSTKYQTQVEREFGWSFCFEPRS